MTGERNPVTVYKTKDGKRIGQPLGWDDLRGSVGEAVRDAIAAAKGANGTVTIEGHSFEWSYGTETPLAA